jgi:hypothetical protein
MTLGFAIAFVFLLASGIFVELCSSENLTIFSEDIKNEPVVTNLIIARSSVFFGLLVVELYFGRMH